MQPRTPPRFVTRTLVATLATVAFVLSAVLLLVTRTVRDHVRRSVVERLETGQRLLVTLEQRRVEDLRRQVATLAASPTLKAALDTYHAEGRLASPDVRSQLIAAVGLELDKLAERQLADVVVARDRSGVLAVSGPLGPAWTAADARGGDQAEATFLTLPSGVFRAVTAPVALQDGAVGSVQLAEALDDQYATELAALSGARILIVSNDRILATTLPSDAAAALTPQLVRTFAVSGLTTIGGDEYAIQPLLREGDSAVYVLDSIDASARPLVRSSLQALTTIAAGALVLAGIASLWLARTISRPIDTISRSLAEMTRTRALDRPLAPSGASLEIDGLTDALNMMMAANSAAEAETVRAALEAMRALAMALDARDPYSSGHSERVSAFSVAIGRELRLDEPQLEVLRVGALLHDIGKVGISEHLLCKPAALTVDEYHVIKTHPTVGSRILRNVRFLEPHLPIVELHHERPDGGGYPLGLRGEKIPLLARIVHVADAYDAMTSARAYRPALPPSAALAELRRCAGTDFDPAVVRAFAAVLGRADASLAHATFPLDAFRAEAGAAGPVRRPARLADALDEFTSEGQIV